MAEATQPGGIYKDATGDGYHDANGKPVDASRDATPPEPLVTVETVTEGELQTVETVAFKPADEVDLSVGVPRGKVRR